MQRHDLPVTRRGDLTDEQWDRIIHICRLDVKGVRSIMYVIWSMVSSGSCGQVLRGEICRLFTETGTPYTNVLPNGNRQGCLNPYSKFFPKMPTCRM